MGRHYRYFVFRKMRSEDHFVFFLVYEVTTLKVTIWPEERGIILQNNFRYSSLQIMRVCSGQNHMNYFY